MSSIIIIIVVIIVVIVIFVLQITWNTGLCYLIAEAVVHQSCVFSCV